MLPAVQHLGSTTAGLRLGGGATRLAFDGDRYGAIGGTTRLRTPGYDHARDRYEIEVGCGAVSLSGDEQTQAHDPSSGRAEPPIQMRRDP